MNMDSVSSLLQDIHLVLKSKIHHKDKLHIFIESMLYINNLFVITNLLKAIHL